MNHKKINPKSNNIKENYHLLISGVSPRPIALVGSKDINNNYNLAPFSFCSAAQTLNNSFPKCAFAVKILLAVNN